MTTIYLIRHGESQGNKEKLFRGRTDFDLSDNGIIQARQLGKRLAGIKFDAVFSSPLKRAYNTAKAIETKITIDERFNSIKLASWEGQPVNVIKNKYPEQWNTWISEPENLKLKDAETIDNVQSRAFKGLTDRVKEFPGAIIAIVTHKAVLKPMVSAALNIQKPYFWRLNFDTASYSILKFSDRIGFSLVLLNETGHLTKPGQESYSC